jgi:chemotaxis protein CheD
LSQIHVGIGGYQTSDDPADEIKTFALGSCVAVITYDSQRKMAGLIHIALPDSSVNAKKAKETPGYFVDTGLPPFLDAALGNSGHGAGTRIKVIGGSNIMDENHLFDIGKRNVLAIKKYLWKKRLGIIAEETGGAISRTVSVCVATGKVVVSSKGKTWEL